MLDTRWLVCRGVASCVAHNTSYKEPRITSCKVFTAQHEREFIAMVSKREQAYYNQDKIWEPYKSAEQRNRANQILTILPEGTCSVLEIGCGNGIITNNINRPFVVGLDMARHPLTHVTKHAVQGSIHSLPIRANKFDLVILAEVLEHLDNATFCKAIEEIKQLSAKYLLITVPFNENVASSSCKCGRCGKLFHPNYHRQSFHNSWFEEVFSDYDLVRITYGSFRIPPSKHIPWLKNKLEVYEYVDTAICDECGGKPAKPDRILEFVFNGLQAVDRRLKRLFNVKEPYHQILLLIQHQAK